MFPNEGLSTVVSNVFDFDSYTKDAQETIISTLNKHGITYGKQTKFEIVLCPKFPLPPANKIGTWGHVSSSAKSSSINVSLDYGLSEIVIENPLPFSPRTFDVDRLDMRSDKFSEQTAYWQLPINDVNIVSDVVSSGSGDIYVSTVNPISLYRINPILKFGSFIEFYYDFFPTSKGYFKPRVKLAALNFGDRSDCLLLHEEMTNTLLMVDTSQKTINVLNVDGGTSYQNLFGKVSKSLYGGDTSYYRMLTNMSSVNGSVVIYQKSGSALDVKDFNLMVNKRINLPFKIDNCFWSSPNSLILTQLSNGETDSATQ